MRSFALLTACIAVSAAGTTSTNAQNSTAFSLVFGYPLLSWQQLSFPVIDDIGTNTWNHNTQLSNADDKEVVKPNVDTLYSVLIYDLTRHDLEITVPSVPKKDFKLFSFFDPYSFNYANVGTDGFYRDGKYLLKLCESCNDSQSIGLRNETSAGYVGIINAPGPYGTLLARWGLTHGLEAVHQRQNKSEIGLLPRSNTSTGSYKPLVDVMKVYNASADATVNILNMLSYYVPPGVHSEEFSAAGVDTVRHIYTPIGSVNLTEANATALEQIQAADMGPFGEVEMNHGWTLPSPTEMGVFGSDYAFRASVCVKDYLALRNPYAIYPEYHNATAETAAMTTQLSVGADEAILMTFFGKPPVEGPAGFWSLTLYDEDFYLIPNNGDVYALGDRSQLTYPNGGLVYPSNHSSNATEGSNSTFQILIQPADITPPSNWTGNWLPAPSSGGQVVTQLRFYAAQQPLLDGTYAYPLVEKVDALVGVPVSTGDSASLSPVGSIGSIVVTALVVLFGIFFFDFFLE